MDLAVAKRVAVPVLPDRDAAVVENQAVAGLVDPASLPRGIAENQGKGRHVAGHHRSGADHRIHPHRVPADNHGRGAERGPPADAGGTKLVLPLDEGPRIDDVGEDHVRAAEDLVLEDHSVVDAHAVLELDAMAQHGPRGDAAPLADDAVLADLCAAVDMAEVPDLRSRADRRRLRRRHCWDERSTACRRPQRRGLFLSHLAPPWTGYPAFKTARKYTISGNASIRTLRLDGRWPRC